MAGQPIDRDKLPFAGWATQGDVLRKLQRLAAESLSCERSAHGVKSDHIDGAAVIIA